jgi:hypothetical protein
MFKKIIAVSAIVVLCSCGIGSGVNSSISLDKNGYFPNLTGIDLQGNKRQLPETFDKPINIVVVAFKREQQANVNGWIYEVDKIANKHPEVAFYELPLIYKLNPLSRSFVNNGMRRGVIDEKSRARTITVYTDREKFFKIMNMNEDKIYLLVIGNKGKILQRIEGDATKKNVALLKKKWSF